MCGRVTLTRGGIAELVEELDAEVSSEDRALYRPRYNVPPSDVCWIVEPGADRRVLLPAIWGYRASGRPLINVRGEQVASGAGFREAFRSRRCLVVTDGFFEWTPKRQPFWYHRSDGGLVLLAGLAQPPAAGDADRRPRFTILTTRANPLVAAVHGRMPVVVAPDHIDDWLAAPAVAAAGLIAPAPEQALLATPVGSRVNSVKNDDPACLSPVDGAASGPSSAPASGRQQRLPL